jgi:hypothetical protein
MNSIYRYITSVIAAAFVATVITAAVPSTALATPGNGNAYGHSHSQNIVNSNQTVAAAADTQATVEHTSTLPAVHTQTVATENSVIPGNNGTVKIDRAPFDSHPDNQPHVGCTFQVDFYNFDKGVGDATVQFALHEPTANGTITVVNGDLTPNIGEDVAGGGTDVDAQQTYTLAFTGEAHPKQGYHVKLTVHAPGSQGADTKHKVFWVKGCNEAAKPVGGSGGHVLAAATVVPANPVHQAAFLANTGTGNMALVNAILGLFIGGIAASAAVLTKKSTR